jgi:hypothetical protein
MQDDFDDMSEMMDDLMQQGALEIVGVDSETGQFLYSFTEKLKEINPIIYQMMMESFYESIVRLWEKGFLSMDITEENPIVKATQKVFDQEAIEKLSAEDRVVLSDILSKMSE